MERIPCFILCFFNAEATIESLEYFSRFKDRLELIVIENYSKYTDDKIKPHILSMLEQDKIDHYYLFEENIKGRALEVVFQENTCNWRGSEYLIITHGDITINNDKWLDEELYVLENYKDFLVCGLEIELGYLREKVPNAAWQYPSPIKDYGRFYECITGGGHVCLWRTEGFKQYFDTLKSSNLQFVDSNQHPFCYSTMKMKWGRLKNITAKHAAWEYNITPSHEYCIMYKGYNRTYEQIYCHDGYCPYTYFGKK